MRQLLDKVPEGYIKTHDVPNTPLGYSTYWNKKPRFSNGGGFDIVFVKNTYKENNER